MLSSLLKVRIIEIERARNIFSRKFTTQDHHLLKTLDQYYKNSNICIQDTHLYKYHKTFLPQNQISALGLKDQCRTSLMVFQNPWGFANLSSQKKNIYNSQFCGPSSDEIIANEFNKIISLYLSIKENGFKYFSRNGVLGGYYLHSTERKKVFVVTQGNHRISVLKYLGHRYVPVYTMKGYLEHVYESQVDSWFAVKNGQCSRVDALRIFHTYF